MAQPGIEYIHIYIYIFGRKCEWTFGGLSDSAECMVYSFGLVSVSAETHQAAFSFNFSQINSVLELILNQR